MIDMNQLVDVLISSKTIKHYINKGYKDIKRDTHIQVPLKDVHDGFRGDVEVECDGLGIKEIISYKTYKNKSQNGKYYSKEYYHDVKRLERISKHYDAIIKFCNEHNYDLLTKFEEIQNNQSDVKYICPIHGLQIAKVTNILQGKQCYLCSRIQAGKKKWSHSLNERQEKIYHKLLDICMEKGYELITKKEEILSVDDYFKYKCPIHGVQEVRIDNFIYLKRGCRECFKENLKIIMLNNTNAKDSISKKNNLIQQNNEYQQNNMIIKKRNNSLDTNEVIRRIEICGGELQNPEEYINQKEKNLIILCPKCKKPFVTSLVLFTQHDGQLCPDCHRTISIGELKIKNYLELHNIPYQPEYWFPDCRDINPLPFDFYLEYQNTIIEYDGEQHYKDRHYFNYSIDKCKLHDEIKNKYCIDNGIKLIRIPYWRINKIDEILDKELFNK